MEITNRESNTEKVPTIGELRKILRETVGKILINEGFSINSKSTELKKKMQNGDISKVYFHCYDYKPSRIEFRLIMVFIIKALDDAMEQHFNSLGEQFNRGLTISLSEGDFHPKVKHLEPRFRNAATHIISDVNTLNEGIQDCENILKKEIIPNFENFSSLEGFQKFVLNDYSSIVRLGLFMPSLIAAKLHSNNETIKLGNYLWNVLELESKSDIHIMKRFVKGLIA